MFYLFASLILLSAFVVVFNRNPIHSVLFLILSFFCSAGLLITIGADFIAMVLLIVYVGAVAVLFLFVIMMLNINLTKLQEGFVKYLPVGVLCALALWANIYFIFHSADYGRFKSIEMNVVTKIGRVLYTDYMMLFQICGVILLTAMIGAVALTLQKKSSDRLKVKSSSSRNSLKIVKVRSGEGLDDQDL